jgi:hypothetical protein
MDSVLDSLQRSAGNAAVSELVARTGSGQALPADVRAAGERRLGADLSDVRLHSDAGAQRFVDSIGAEAATIGRDVFLGPYAGNERSVAGRRTLMHELAHVAQSSGASKAGPSGVSHQADATEREASSIGRTGLSGPSSFPAQTAAVNVVHRKVADEEEVEQPADEKIPDFLNPEPLTDEEIKAGGGPQPQNAGDFGASEGVAFEVRVVAPLRRALAAVSQTEWETAYQRMEELGGALWEYEQMLEKRNPALAAELRGIRGWMALAVNQIKGRFGGNSMSDAHIESLLEAATTDLESVGGRLG